MTYDELLLLQISIYIYIYIYINNFNYIYNFINNIILMKLENLKKETTNFIML